MSAFSELGICETCGHVTDNCTCPFTGIPDSHVPANDIYREAVQALYNASQELYRIARQVGTPQDAADNARGRAGMLNAAAQKLDQWTL